jgi:UDP:flavonoid glycosyltransferase YjiC (YdhE family)
MKVLFIADGSPATVYAIAPLATALRNAGHDILLAANEPLLESAETIGIPSVSVTDQPIGKFMAAGRRENAVEGGRDQQGEMYGIGRGFARMGSATLDALIELTRDWPADLIVGGSMCYGAGLLASQIKVPYVRQAWDIVPMSGPDAGAAFELRSVFEQLGLPGLPEPDLFVDVCPPSLQLAPVAGARLMRWIPVNRQRRLEPWMYAKQAGRPRVLITSGTRSPVLRTPGSSLRELVDQLAATGAEVLIAAPEQAAAEVGAELQEIRVGWMPLDVVAPTCDLAVHHGGATTAMSFMAAGVPQLILPENAHTKTVAGLLAGYGAAVIIEAAPGAELDVAGAIGSGSQEILSSPGFTERAGTLAGEIAGLPGPAALVPVIEGLI